MPSPAQKARRKRVADFFVSMGLSVLNTASPEGWHTISDEEAKDRFTNYKSRFVDVDGTEIHYRIEGEGPPLVMMHGFGASLHIYDNWVKLLQKDFRIIRLDLPGFGLSTPFDVNSEVSIDVYVRVLNGFLDKLGLDQCYLLGNSFGGWLAWEYASIHPERVKQLVLVNAAGFFTEGTRPRGAGLAKKPAMRKLLRTGLPRFVVKRVFLQSYVDRRKMTKAIIDRYYGLTNRDGNLLSLIKIASSEVVTRTNKLPSIQAPTLILWGAQDRIIHVKDGSEFERLIPAAKLIVYDNTGHVPMTEMPVQSASDIKNFLKRNEGA